MAYQFYAKAGLSPTLPTRPKRARGRLGLPTRKEPDLNQKVFSIQADGSCFMTKQVRVTDSYSYLAVYTRQRLAIAADYLNVSMV